MHSPPRLSPKFADLNDEWKDRINALIEHTWAEPAHRRPRLVTSHRQAAVSGPSGISINFSEYFGDQIPGDHESVPAAASLQSEMTLLHYLAGAPRAESAEARVPTSDPRITLRRLVDLLQVIVPDRPTVTAALEQCIETIVVDEMRHRIAERLLRLSAEDIAKVEALTAHLAHELSTPPDDEAV
jgi:signal transduction histidine kinase